MQTSTEPRQPELLGAVEAMAILGIPRSRFYQLAKADQLPFPTFRIGHRFMFSRRQVEALLDRRHNDPIDTAPVARTA